MGSDLLGHVAAVEVAQVLLPPDITHVTSGATDARDVTARRALGDWQMSIAAIVAHGAKLRRTRRQAGITLRTPKKAGRLYQESFS